jgi:SAM-dependent methyltransferase
MIQMIGGEMPAFTEPRAPVGGALHRYLLDQLPAGADVLIAGPHADDLIGALAERTRVTCLLRSQPDAIDLDARGLDARGLDARGLDARGLDGHGLDSHGLDIRCGTIAKLTEPERYDVVVALDGLDRLCSAEGPQYDWVETLQALKRTLRPGGMLLLAVENELGVHRLVDPSSPTAAQDDGAWRPLGEFDTKPGNPARLAARLAAEGLAVDWLGSAWPVPAAPTLIATPDAMRDGPVDALAAVAASAVARAYARRSVLSDPRRLAAAAVRGGLGAELAAAWLVVAYRAPRPGRVLTLPPILIGGDQPTGDAVVEVGPDGEAGWTRRVVRGNAADGTLPTGRLLEELLLGAALRHDLPTLRRLLTGWMAALPGATADNVVVDHDRFAVLDPSRPETPDALRRFGQTLLGGVYPHPWPAATDLGTLTAILHGAAGLRADAPAPAAAEGSTDTDTEAAPDSRREHAEQLRALQRQLADAASRVQWYEAELDKRDGQLRDAHFKIAAFSGNLSYRVARLGLRAARTARNHLRKGTT